MGIIPGGGGGIRRPSHQNKVEKCEDKTRASDLLLGAGALVAIGGGAGKEPGMDMADVCRPK